MPPSMGPVVVVPVPHGPTPSAAPPTGPGRPAATPPAVAPGPSRTCSGGRPVPPPPPPAVADDGKHGSRTAARTDGRDASRVTDDEKASRPPRGGPDDDRGAEGDEDEGASHGREDTDDEWDD
ncbi:hypothetical protein I6J42_31800 [Streptomyces californicus]|uniref:Uncharacterized protein n=1 Tax=Streptomyces californicus TaxID=67351 RepID=A0ABD7D3Q2_9ACTN|nr:MULTISPECIES: hypothetical protein [Streptomyces]QRV26190.1 hypothetical protein I6J39_01955 [Streptomyces californicus]QRV38147.1 hypothetical protein I6J42_31800 [Streptomyces californicus]QRV39592.1 hypothetical protein I6J41_01785 [Streptomyces californicus]QRV46341.1 hypothetical protein I6J43_01825 [Streptomyces californicus]